MPRKPRKFPLWFAAGLFIFLGVVTAGTATKVAAPSGPNPEVGPGYVADPPQTTAVEPDSQSCWPVVFYANEGYRVLSDGIPGKFQDTALDSVDFLMSVSQKDPRALLILYKRTPMGNQDQVDWSQFVDKSGKCYSSLGRSVWEQTQYQWTHASTLVKGDAPSYGCNFYIMNNQPNCINENITGNRSGIMVSFVSALPGNPSLVSASVMTTYVMNRCGNPVIPPPPPPPTTTTTVPPSSTTTPPTTAPTTTTTTQPPKVTTTTTPTPTTTCEGPGKNANCGNTGNPVVTCPPGMVLSRDGTTCVWPGTTTTTSPPSGSSTTTTQPGQGSSGTGATNTTVPPTTTNTTAPPPTQPTQTTNPPQP